MRDIKYYDDIENYITNKVYPNDLTANQKTAMRKRVRSYELRTDGLYYKMKGIFLKIIISESDRLEAIKKAHVINDGEGTDFHLDRVKTFNRLCSEFKVYWKEIATDINDYMTNHCTICCNFEYDVPKNDFELDRSKNWEKVIVAILGPFIPTKSDHKHICVLVDPESRWIEASPMNEKTSGELAKCIKHVFLIFGWSLCYYLNMRPEFVREVDKLLVKFGEEFENSCVDINITLDHERRNIPPYRRSYTAGIVTDGVSSFRSVTSVLGENFANFLDNYLAYIGKDVNLHDANWEKFLPATLRQLRTEISDDRGYSPFYAMHNYNPNITLIRTEIQSADSTSEQMESEPIGFESAVIEDLKFNADQRTSLKTYSRENKTKMNSFQSLKSNSNQQVENEANDWSDTIVVSNSVEEVAIEDNTEIPVDDSSEIYEMDGNKRKLISDGDCDNTNHPSKKVMSTEVADACLSIANDTTLNATDCQSDEPPLKCPHCLSTINCWSDLQKQGCSQSEVHVCVTQVPVLKETRQCNYCNKFFTKIEGMSHQNNYQSRVQTSRSDPGNQDFPYRCKHCDFKTRIQKHIDEHTHNHRENGFPCGICNQVFTTSSSLLTHAKIHSTNKLASKCEQCGIQMANTNALLQHVKYLHETADRLPSQVCREVGRNMNLSSNLTLRKGKPFKCDQCEYSCKLESALQNHQDLFHNETDRQYSCTMCPYRSQTSKQLREHFNSRHNHKQDSSRFTCQFCSMKFKTTTALRHHLPVHTEQHLYSCNVCSFSAKFRQTLHNHVKTTHPDHLSKDTIKGTPTTSVSCVPLTESDPTKENCDASKEDVYGAKEVEYEVVTSDAFDDTRETFLLVVEGIDDTTEEIVFCTNENI